MPFELADLPMPFSFVLALPGVVAALGVDAVDDGVLACAKLLMLLMLLLGVTCLSFFAADVTGGVVDVGGGVEIIVVCPLIGFATTNKVKSFSVIL